MNQQKSKEAVVFGWIDNLSMPLPIKQIIKHMIRFDSRDRIPIFALFRSLKDIMGQFELQGQ
jgi:hypothetical protein